MLKGGLVSIWELDMNLVPTLFIIGFSSQLKMNENSENRSECVGGRRRRRMRACRARNIMR